MGIRKKGVLTQNFEIRIDVENLSEYIAETIKKNIAEDKAFSNVEVVDSFFDGNELIITGSYDTKYESWYSRATLECPEEDEVEREYIGNHPWIISTLPIDIYKHIRIDEVIEEDSMIENNYD